MNNEPKIDVYLNCYLDDFDLVDEVKTPDELVEELAIYHTDRLVDYALEYLFSVPQGFDEIQEHRLDCGESPARLGELMPEENIGPVAAESVKELVSWLRDQKPSGVLRRFGDEFRSRRFPDCDPIQFAFDLGVQAIVDIHQQAGNWDGYKSQVARQTVSDRQIRQAMESVSGNKTQAAKLLGISRKQLYYRLNSMKDDSEL